MGEECSITFIPDIVVKWLPEGADNVPTLVGVPLTSLTAVTWYPKLGKVKDELVCVPVIRIV